MASPLSADSSTGTCRLPSEASRDPTSYPPAPWRLKGCALVGPRLIAMEAAQPAIPRGLRLLPVLPGMTAGGIYIAQYGSGSTLEYHELIVAAGSVYHGARIGIWVSHIYVDTPDSAAGGRAIWGLPKQLAEFTWQEGQISVRQGDALLCSVRYAPSGGDGRVRLPLPAFSCLEERVVWFRGDAGARIGAASATWTIPNASPLAPLVHSGDGPTFGLWDLDAAIDAPSWTAETGRC